MKTNIFRGESSDKSDKIYTLMIEKLTLKQEGRCVCSASVKLAKTNVAIAT